MSTQALKSIATGSKAIATPTTGIVAIASAIELNRAKIQSALPKHVPIDRIIRAASSALQANPDLAKCTPQSFVQCLLQSATLGLEPNTVQQLSYFIPYRNNAKNVTEAQFQIGYRGLIDLARRSGNIARIEAHVVYSTDTFTAELGDSPKLKHIPNYDGEQGDMRLAYAIAFFKDGGSQYVVLAKKRIDEIRKRSKAGASGPWATDTGEMWKKTAVKQLCKWLPLSIDLYTALEYDTAAEAGTVADAFFGLTMDAPAAVTQVESDGAPAIEVGATGQESTENTGA